MTKVAAKMTPEMYRQMPLQTALRLAVTLSGKSDPEIAAAMSWTKTVENRVFSNGDYYPSLPTVVKFCDVVGNTILPEWIIANCGNCYDMAEPMDAVALISSMGNLFGEMAEVASEGKAALADDGKVDAAEAKRILKKLRNVIAVGADMMGRLQARVEAEK